MTNGGGTKAINAIKGVKGFNAAAILIFSHIEKHEIPENNLPKSFRTQIELI